MKWELNLQMMEDFFRIKEDLVSMKTKKYFLFSFLFGMIVHFACYSTNEVGNPDSVLSKMVYRAGAWEISLGRWGLLLDGLRLGVVSNVINSCVSIIGMACVSVIFLRFQDEDQFNYERKEGKLIGLLIMVSPAFAACLTYYFCSDLYTASILAYALGAYVIKKAKSYKTAFCGSCLIVLGLSIYQAYIGVAAGLLVMDLVNGILHEEKPLKDYYCRIFRYAFAGFGAIFIYYILNMIVLRACHIPISTYSGADQIGLSRSLYQIPTSVVKICRALWEYFIGDGFLSNSLWHSWVFHCLLILLFHVLILAQMIRCKLYREPGKIVLLYALLAVYPFAANLIGFIATERDLGILMAVPMTMMVPAMLHTAFRISDGMRIRLFRSFCIILSIYFVYVYTYMDNSLYMARKLTYNKVYGIASRILDRVEPLYENVIGHKVMIIGDLNTNGDYYLDNEIYHIAVDTADVGLTWPTYYESKRGWPDIFKLFFGIHIDMFTEEEYMEVVQSDDFAEMEIFPAQDSVRVLDGWIVVKLSDSVFMP